MTLLIKDSDLEYTYNPDIPAEALVWVIGEDCVYDKPLSLEHAQIFLESDEAINISDSYPDHDGIVVKLLKQGEALLELMTTEYFGNVLLSNPQVLKLREYPYGAYVVSPKAKFDGEKFIPLHRNMENLEPWPEYLCCPKNSIAG
jgi:hypothetical protein